MVLAFRVLNPCVPAPEQRLGHRALIRVWEHKPCSEVDGEVRLQLRGQRRVSRLQKNHDRKLTTSVETIRE